MLRWLFFDVGSTLVDETLCDQARIADTLRTSTVSAEAFITQLHAFAAQNADAYKACLKHFSLTKAPWRSDLEQLYPGVPALMQQLSGRYSLGIIANQNAGLEKRLHEWGILPYFRVIASSHDIGAAKPDPAIFEKALAAAGCSPQEACMIGDRLDNDILPAQRLGMRTIWVRQGLGGLGNPLLLSRQPDAIIERIGDLSAALGLFA